MEFIGVSAVAVIYRNIFAAQQTPLMRRSSHFEFSNAASVNKQI